MSLELYEPTRLTAFRSRFFAFGKTAKAPLPALLRAKKGDAYAAPFKFQNSIRPHGGLLHGRFRWGLVPVHAVIVGVHGHFTFIHEVVQVRQGFAGGHDQVAVVDA